MPGKTAIQTRRNINFDQISDQIAKLEKQGVIEVNTSLENYFKYFNMLHIGTITLFNLQTEEYTLPPNTQLFTIYVKACPTDTYFALEVDEEIFFNNYDYINQKQANVAENFLSSVLCNNLLDYAKHKQPSADDKTVYIYSNFIKSKVFLNYLEETKDKALSEFFVLFLDNNEITNSDEF